VSTINIVAALIGAVGAALVVSSLTGGLQGLFDRLGSKASRRMARLIEQEEQDPMRLTLLDEQPAAARVVGPFLSELGGRIGSLIGSAEKDSELLMQAGYPAPMRTLGDFYAFKVISAFVLFASCLVAASLAGSVLFVYLGLGAGVLGLYMPDMTVRNQAKQRQDSFRAEMAFTLDRIAMMLGAGTAPEDAIRRIVGTEFGGGGVAEDALRRAATQGGGLFAMKLREVVVDLNSGRRTLVEALREVEKEFPLDEYRGFVDLVELSIEQGSRLVSTLGDMAENMQNDVEAELLARGLRSTPRMVLIMGLAMINVFVLIGAPMMSMFLGWD
jgi:Flp pilus assembly protein TadB